MILSSDLNSAQNNSVGYTLGKRKCIVIPFCFPMSSLLLVLIVFVSLSYLSLLYFPVVSPNPSTVADRGPSLIPQTFLADRGPSLMLTFFSPPLRIWLRCLWSPVD